MALGIERDALPDVFSQGETLEEARANLADALNLVLEHHRDEARGRAVNGALREPLQLVASCSCQTSSGICVDTAAISFAKEERTQSLKNSSGRQSGSRAPAP